MDFAVGSATYTCGTLKLFVGNDHLGSAPAEWDRPPGTPVGVWYDPADPNVNALIVDRPTHARPAIALALGGFLALMTVYTDRDARRATAREPGGVATTATAKANSTPPPALAAGGLVAGRFMLDGAPVALTHATALRHGSAEGNAGRPLTLVVVDRAMPAGTLEGGGEKAVGQLASAGRLRGLMLRFDPARPAKASLTVLGRRQRESAPGGVDVGSQDTPAVSGLHVYADQVHAAIELAPADAKALAASFKFYVRAPLVKEGGEWKVGH